MPGSSPTLPGLVADGVLDAELAALCWLLVQGGVPVVVTGEVGAGERARVADALMDLPPTAARAVVDIVGRPPDLSGLGALLRRGTRVALLAAATDLRALMDGLTGPPDGLPEDAIRRLGLVLVVGSVPTVTPGPVRERLRVLAAHYLRPIERDAQGHVQRRPPAVLATWDATSDAFDHFAWGVTSELADRVDRSQASFEELQDRRAAAVLALARRVADAPSLEDVLAAEPPRSPAPPRPPAEPSPIRSPLNDPHVH